MRHGNLEGREVPRQQDVFNESSTSDNISGNSWPENKHKHDDDSDCKIIMPNIPKAVMTKQALKTQAIMLESKYVHRHNLAGQIPQALAKAYPAQHNMRTIGNSWYVVSGSGGSSGSQQQQQEGKAEVCGRDNF